MTIEEAAKIARPRMDAYNAWLTQAVNVARETYKNAKKNTDSFSGRIGAILNITPPLILHNMFCSCITNRLSLEMYPSGGLVIVDHIVCKEHAAQFRIPAGEYFRFAGKDNSYEDMPEVRGIMNDPSLH